MVFQREFTAGLGVDRHLFGLLSANAQVPHLPGGLHLPSPGPGLRYGNSKSTLLPLPVLRLNVRPVLRDRTFENDFKSEYHGIS